MQWFFDAMNWLTRTLGRFLFAIPFAIFGIFHFTSGPQMAQMVPIPGGVIWVYLTGAALIAAAVSIVIGVRDKLATFLLGIFLLLTALLVHFAGMSSAATEGAAQASMSNMLKDLALAGGAWMYAGSVSARDKGKEAAKAGK